jgi:hypothetical protein
MENKIVQENENNLHMRIEVNSRLVSQATLPAIRLETCARVPSIGSTPEQGINVTKTRTNGYLENVYD